MKITEDYVFFWGGPFSQWFKSEFTLEGEKFTSAEQYMMWKKAMLFEDTEVANAIMRTNNPKEQKALGRKVRGFDKKKWESVCVGYVTKGNYAKFTQNPDLLLELKLQGEREIVEASPYDRIWGIGKHFNDDDIEDKSSWKGTNWLGIAIMNVRETLKIEGKL